MVRCPRCRAELRLSSIILVTTPLPAQVIPGTSTKSPVEQEAFDADATVDLAGGAPFLGADPFPRPRPPPPPPSSRNRQASTDRTVLDPSALDMSGRAFDFAQRPSPSAAQASPNARASVDATAYQAPISAPVFAAAPPKIIDVDSTAPMSRPPTNAVGPTPVPAEAADAAKGLFSAPAIGRQSEPSSPADAAIAAPPERADQRPSGAPMRERFAQLEPHRRRYQLQFVIAVVASLTLSAIVDAVLGTGPFFRTIASLFTVSVAGLWVLVVAASAAPSAETGAWSLGAQGIANVLSPWRRVLVERSNWKTLASTERVAVIGRAIAAIGAPLAVGFELLRFLQLAMYGFFDVGSGSAVVFNVLSTTFAVAALVGLVLARAPEGGAARTA
jgi:hypothetical protein